MKTKPIKNPLAYIAKLKKQNAQLLDRIEIWQEMHKGKCAQIEKLKQDLHYAGECIKITERTIETIKNGNDWWKNYAEKVEGLFNKAGFEKSSIQKNEDIASMSSEELEKIAFDPNTPEELSKSAIEQLNINKTKNSNEEYDPKSLTKLIRSNHLQNRDELIEKMKQKSLTELIENFLVEMDAKNKAYYFIIENDLMLKFKKYCEKDY